MHTAKIKHKKPSGHWIYLWESPIWFSLLQSWFHPCRVLETNSSKWALLSYSRWGKGQAVSYTWTCLPVISQWLLWYCWGDNFHKRWSGLFSSVAFLSFSYQQNVNHKRPTLSSLAVWIFYFYFWGQNCSLVCVGEVGFRWMCLRVWMWAGEVRLAYD